MGIFDVFKTKVGEAREKASDMMDKKKSGAAAETSAPGATGTEDSNTMAAESASDMVSEGAPVSSTGEAAPGMGDDGAPAGREAGAGMTQSIKDNVEKGADKAADMAKDASGHRYDDKIDSGVKQAKDKLG